MQFHLAGSATLAIDLVDQYRFRPKFVAPVNQMNLADAMLDRYSASSTAVLPPPTTHTSWPR